MRVDPLEYIREVNGVGVDTGKKELFNDANFEKNRQKTTERSRNYKKVMKIYDKTFEAKNKGRNVDDNVLRVETIYKRQNVPLSEIFDSCFLRKATGRFYNDWNNLAFVRELRADKGMKASQIEKAREIMRVGTIEYAENCKKAYRDGRMTKKQWETVRTFIKVWKDIRVHFTMIPKEKEIEYKSKLLHEFQQAIN